LLGLSIASPSNVRVAFGTADGILAARDLLKILRNTIQPFGGVGEYCDAYRMIFARSIRLRWSRRQWRMDNDLTDEQLERFALMVEHLPPDEAQRAYEAKIEAARVMAEVERKKS